MVSLLSSTISFCLHYLGERQMRKKLSIMFEGVLDVFVAAQG